MIIYIALLGALGLGAGLVMHSATSSQESHQDVKRIDIEDYKLPHLEEQEAELIER